MSKPVIRCRVQFNGGTDFTKKVGLEPGGRVQKIIDKSVLDFNALYIPMKSGTMNNSAYTATQIGSGTVIYPQKYSHYQYKGIVYGPNIPIYEDNTGVPTGFFSPKNKSKYPTDRQLNYSTDINPMAQKEWFETMKKNHVEDILEKAKDAAEKGG